MLMNELVELKKQIAKLQAKGFICPSSPHGEPLPYWWRRKTRLSGCVWITVL
jgi:hypothetical protein